MERGGGRRPTEACPEARPKKLVPDKQVDTWPVREVLQAQVVQPAVTAGGT